MITCVNGTIELTFDLNGQNLVILTPWNPEMNIQCSHPTTKIDNIHYTHYLDREYTLHLQKHQELHMKLQ